MKLKKPGKCISADVEVLNISIHGFWFYVKGKEYFMSYEQYPWFKNARIKEIFNVNLLHSEHLYWPDLDVDLEIEAIEHPEKYPLIAKNS